MIARSSISHIMDSVNTSVLLQTETSHMAVREWNYDGKGQVYAQR